MRGAWFAVRFQVFVKTRLAFSISSWCVARRSTNNAELETCVATDVAKTFLSLDYGGGRSTDSQVV